MNEVLSEVKIWCNRKEKKQYGTPMLRPLSWSYVLNRLNNPEQSSTHRRSVLFFPSADNFANLFALIKTVEKLEKSYVNSAAPSNKYETTCAELIAKYKTLRNTLSDAVPDIQHFMATYSMHCVSARHRLQVGFPATIEHRVNRPGDASAAVSVAECVHHYIGAMDTLKLNMSAKDQISPCLSDLLVTFHKVPQLPAEFAGKACIRRWLQRLDGMRASDELTDDEVRQLLFDIENSYNSFMQLLGGRGAVAESAET